MTTTMTIALTVLGLIAGACIYRLIRGDDRIRSFDTGAAIVWLIPCGITIAILLLTLVPGPKNSLHFYDASATAQQTCATHGGVADLASGEAADPNGNGYYLLNTLICKDGASAQFTDGRFEAGVPVDQAPVKRP